MVVIGNPEMKGPKGIDGVIPTPLLPKVHRSEPILPGSRDKFKDLGAVKVVQWMKDQPQVLLTDTTMRDAHRGAG